jgi:glucokinase
MTVNNKKIAIGVDFGGTNIRAGAVTIGGELIGAPVAVTTNAHEEKECIRERVFDVISQIIKNNHFKRTDIVGIGMGVTGPLDVQNGKILQCPSLPTMDFFPLRKVVEERFDLPVSMNNDANAMMLGEAFWGAGKSFSTILGITLGTGFGCAVIIDKKIWMGSTETAGEIWISPYNNGMIEDVVSGKGISSLYKNLSGEEISAIEVSKRAYGGDEEAIAAWNEFGKATAFALSWCVNLLDPEVIIIGGSIANSHDLFLPTMEKQLRRQICPVPAGKIQIAKAQLGDNAGFMGAAALVYS